MKIINWQKHLEKVFDGYYKHMRLEASFRPARYNRLDEQIRKTGKK